MCGMVECECVCVAEELFMHNLIRGGSISSGKAL